VKAVPRLQAVFVSMVLSALEVTPSKKAALGIMVVLIVLRD